MPNSSRRRAMASLSSTVKDTASPWVPSRSVVSRVVIVMLELSAFSCQLSANNWLGSPAFAGLGGSSCAAGAARKRGGWRPARGVDACPTLLLLGDSGFLLFL